MKMIDIYKKVQYNKSMVQYDENFHTCIKKNFDKSVLMIAHHLDRLLLVLHGSNEVTPPKIGTKITRAPIQHLADQNHKYLL